MGCPPERLNIRAGGPATPFSVPQMPAEAHSHSRHFLQSPASRYRLVRCLGRFSGIEARADARCDGSFDFHPTIYFALTSDLRCRRGSKSMIRAPVCLCVSRECRVARPTSVLTGDRYMAVLYAAKPATSMSVINQSQYSRGINDALGSCPLTALMASLSCSRSGALTGSGA